MHKPVQGRMWNPNSSGHFAYIRQVYRASDERAQQRGSLLASHETLDLFDLVRYITERR